MSDSELQLAQFSLDRAPIGVLRIALDGRLVSANEFICQKLGYSRAELSKMTIFDINPTFTPEDWQRHIKLFVGQPTTRTFESLHRRKSGVTFPVEVSVNYLQFDGQEFFVACSRDLSDQKLADAERTRLQTQLSNSQRLDAVGRLAGGVAHDFNNMLTVILGRAEELLDEVGPASPWREGLEEIQQAARQSAELTRQLLTYARRGPSTPVVLNLDESVGGTLKMLRRLIGSDIEVAWRPAPELWPVTLDPGQVEQLLVNLAVNARDAIAGNGHVEISTANVTIDPAAPPHPSLRSGEYVRLSVRDDGAGMDEATREKIFEPFFSTKPAGRGTGLGLATVYGIVSQSAGTIVVDSQPGHGTTFSLYFPRSRAQVSPALPQRETFVTRGGTERVLLVEDDPMVLRLTRGLLESLGYQVVPAETPSHALELMGGAFDVILTDLQLPQMSGRELAHRARAALPGIAVLLVSGHLEEPGPDVPAGTARLRKPFTRTQLDQAVRAALDARPR